MKNSNLQDITKEIEDVALLESTISDNPNDIYLIDSEKIISKNIINEKINFFKPKDSIYKETLLEYGIDDMCFNSNEALVNYIINKIDNFDNSEIVISNVNSSIGTNKEVDMSDITKIEEINESDLLCALGTSIDIEAPTLLSDNIVSNSDIDENKIELSSENIDEVSELLKQLLNNKTLELSIKIKDS